MALKKVFGVYQTEQEAHEAITNLLNMGYTREDISILSKNHDTNTIDDLATDRTATVGNGDATSDGLAGGAAAGATLGGVAGLLASLGALAIPGIGPILAAGPIAATLSGALAGGTIGGTLGLLGGALVDAGVPEEDARYIDERFNQGDIVVFVDADETKYEEASRYLNYDSTSHDVRRVNR